jgi:hypothetical protein
MTMAERVDRVIRRAKAAGDMRRCPDGRHWLFGDGDDAVVRDAVFTVEPIADGVEPI